MAASDRGQLSSCRSAGRSSVSGHELSIPVVSGIHGRFRISYEDEQADGHDAHANLSQNKLPMSRKARTRVTYSILGLTRSAIALCEIPVNAVL